jgi:uncharacterized membrane protein
MNKQAISRIASVLVGAAVLFGLEQKFGMQFYFAIPAAALAYLVTLVALGLALGTDEAAK